MIVPVKVFREERPRSHAKAVVSSGSLSSEVAQRMGIQRKQFGRIMDYYTRVIPADPRIIGVHVICLCFCLRCPPMKNLRVPRCNPVLGETLHARVRRYSRIPRGGLNRESEWFSGAGGLHRGFCGRRRGGRVTNMKRLPIGGIAERPRLPPSLPRGCRCEVRA